MTNFVARYSPVGAQPSLASARTDGDAFADSPFGGAIMLTPARAT